MEPKYTLTSPLYDDCNYQLKLQDSLGPYQWVTQVVKENPEACNVDQSPFMQHPFYSIPKDKVDIESELRLETRKLSRCPENKFQQNCKDCENCNAGIPCECIHCKTKKYQNELKDCVKSKLVPVYSRKDKSCEGRNYQINRFNHLDEDLQDLNKIQSNSYIGVNARNMAKDSKTTS